MLIRFLTEPESKFNVIDGSTDRCCIAIVTNERALLSGSDQPIQKLGHSRILYVRREQLGGKTNFQRPPHLHNGTLLISAMDTN